MSTRLRDQLNLSIEDESNLDLPIGEDTGAESLEAELAGVADADREVIDADNAVESLEEAHTSLESIRLTLESALADGGLDIHGAAMFRHAYQASALRLGMNDGVPSLESFGGDADRVVATRISLEGIKEQAQKLWEAIKRTVQKWIAAVQAFWYKIFGTAPRLVKRAKALAEAAAKDKGGDKEKIKVEGAVLELAEKPALGSAVVGVAEDIFGAYSKDTVRFGEEIASFLKEVNVSDDKEFASSVHKITAIKVPVPAACSQAGNATEFGHTGTHVVKVSHPGPAGKILVSLSPKAESYEGLAGAKEYLDSALSASKVYLTTAKGYKSPEAKEIEALQRPAIEALAKEADRLGDLVWKFERVWKGASTVKASVVAAGDVYSKKDSDKLTGEAGSLAKNLTKLVQSAAKGIDGGQSEFAKYALSTGAAMVALGEKSLKASAKKAEPKKD